MIRVFLVDDYQAIRSGIKALLSPVADIKVVGEAADYAGALEGYRQTGPDIVLVDIHLPGNRDGLDLTAQIVAGNTSAKVVILTASGKLDHIRGAMKAGARGYLTQSSLTEKRLAGAIRTVAGGGVVLDGKVSPMSLSSQELDFSRLTGRERRVLGLLGEGLSNKEIAGRLAVDPKTVRNHLNNAYAKLNLKSRVQAALMARDLRV